MALLFNTAGPAAPDDLTEVIVAAVAGPKIPSAVPYPGDLPELAGQYRGVGRGRAQTLTFAVADGGPTVAGSAQPQPLIYPGDGVFGRRSAYYQFIRSNGKVMAARVDFVSVNTVLARQ